MAPDDPTPAATPRAGQPERVFNCKCGTSGTATQHVLGGEVPPHGKKVLCRDCGAALGWQKKPENLKKRTDKNASHRRRWKEAQGDLVCHICLVKSENTRAVFHIDHIKPLEFGGVDEFRNTRPLCTPCHRIRHALLEYQRNIRGLSSRNDAA